MVFGNTLACARRQITENPQYKLGFRVFVFGQVASLWGYAFSRAGADALACVQGMAVEAPLRKALEFLVHHQYLHSRQLPHRLWRVTRGSGMGLKHSGALTDLAFYSKVERWMCHPEMMAAHHVAFYRL